MGILGVKNRTENWKTVEAFAPLLIDKQARYRLAQELLNNLGENLDCPPDEVKLELFWNGVRDYLHWKDQSNTSGSTKTSREERYTRPLAETYQELFPNLRTDIGEGSLLTLPENWSYQASEDESKRKLFHNLHGTEMDIVLDTPSYLFVGEAKDESGLGTNGNLILVHQLIRQYVTARVLLRFAGNSKKKVALFSVVRKRESFLRTYQVRFVLDKGWLCKDNVLTWGYVKDLTD